MRHNKKFNHLGRTASHRSAMLSNMAASLILHKRITTTLAKAKALRSYVEPLVNRTKEDTTHSRRMVFAKLQNKYAVTELFQNIGPKVADRPGGYTRILKIGRRRGDDAMICLIELVDFNEDRLVEKKETKSSGRTRRSRRGSGKGKANTPVEGASEKKAEPKKTELKDEAPAEEKPKAAAEETETKE